MSYVELWARAFLLTLGTELALGVPLLGRESPRLRRFGAVVAGNAVSHPVLWFVIARAVQPYGLVLLVGEAWAVLFETLLYRLLVPRVGWSRAFLVSLLANAASVGVGLLARDLGVRV